MANVATATSTDVQNNFGGYLNAVVAGQQVIITRNGRKVARLIPEGDAVASLTDSLTGILKGTYDADAERDAALENKYGERP